MVCYSEPPFKEAPSSEDKKRQIATDRLGKYSLRGVAEFSLGAVLLFLFGNLLSKELFPKEVSSSSVFKALLLRKVSTESQNSKAEGLGLLEGARVAGLCQQKNITLMASQLIEWYERYGNTVNIETLSDIEETSEDALEALITILYSEFDSPDQWLNASQRQKQILKTKIKKRLTYWYQLRLKYDSLLPHTKFKDQVLMCLSRKEPVALFNQ